MDNQPEPPRGAIEAQAQRLFRRGTAISVLYVGAMGGYAWHQMGPMRAMKPDDFATFLSGVFAPLAFLWLVLGFRQQGDELQNSARALWLQGEELRNSVEQQRQLVEVSRDQLAADYTRRMEEEQEADQAAQPKLHSPGTGGSYSGDGSRTLSIPIVSGGPACTEVKAYANGVFVIGSSIMAEGGQLRLVFNFGLPEDVKPQDIVLQYTDARGNRREQRFHAPTVDAGGVNGDRTLGNAVKVQGAKPVADSENTEAST